MKYLLDTCTLLWLAQGSPQLSYLARDIIADPDNEGAVSVVSFWELSMKSVVGKLPLNAPPIVLERRAKDNGLTILPLIVLHVEQFHQLPVAHKDAFDRLLAAIAFAGDYTILSPDPAFDVLGVTRSW